MLDSRTAPYGALVLRLCLAGLFIADVYREFAIEGVSAWWAAFARAGYPDWALYYALVAEFAGAVLLLLGIYTRWVSLCVLPFMVATTQFWAVRKGFYFMDGGYELPLVWSIMLLVQALLGDGAYALKVSSLLRRGGAPQEATSA